jgi:cytochrome oxidase Cu insertion factor (SCO1/SenC/PrrC family)
MLAAALLAGALLGCSGRSTGSTGSAGSATAAVSASGFSGAALPGAPLAPAFTLTDQHGRPQSLAAHRGQVTIVAFLYPTCGSTCVLIAQQIRGALDQLALPVPVLLISAEPAADTPAAVARFLARVSLAGRAEYLSGPRRRLQAVWRSYRITPPSRSRNAFQRAASVLLIDRRGRERVLLGLEQLTPEALAHDIGKLQAG